MAQEDQSPRPHPQVERRSSGTRSASAGSCLLAITPRLDTMSSDTALIRGSTSELAGQLAIDTVQYGRAQRWLYLRRLPLVRAASDLAQGRLDDAAAHLTVAEASISSTPADRRYRLEADMREWLPRTIWCSWCWMRWPCWLWARTAAGTGPTGTGGRRLTRR
jgi:hypothetical protein